MADIAIFRINYKSDFVLTVNSDAGWAIPFCIKFWTGMPSHGYFAGFDGENYVNCRVGETPTQLLVMFDDHHMPIGELKMQIAYHTTIEEFPDRKFDEVTNPTNVTVDIDGTEYQVMLDFTGETGAEIDFSMPSSGVMSVNGKIGYVTLTAEDVGAQPTIEDLATIRSGAAEGATAVQPAEMTAALATKQDTISDLANIRSGAAAGATAVQPAALQEGLAGKQDTISDLYTIRSGAAAGATAVQPAAITPIQTALQTIEAVIPSAATAQNQLADKNFVNSSIATNTANFVGTFNSLSELQAVQNPTNNDYGFVIEQDAQGNEYYDRYKYVASSQQWLFEYKVESTPFTAAQWAAIQSGITSALVTKLNALPTNAELQQTLDGKANTSDIPTALSQLSQDSTHRVVTDSEKSTWNGKQNAIDDLATIRSGAAAGATAVQPAAMNTALAAKQDTLTFDNTPTANSSNPVKSSGIKTALDAKQSTISTVNVTVDNNTGTPSGSASVSGSTLSLSFQNLKGATGATGATGPQGPQGERGLPGESGVTGDVSGFTVIQTIDPSATYGPTDIAGAATVQATNAQLTELEGVLNDALYNTADVFTNSSEITWSAGNISSKGALVTNYANRYTIVDIEVNVEYRLRLNNSTSFKLNTYKYVNNKWDKISELSSLTGEVTTTFTVTDSTRILFMFWDRPTAAQVQAIPLIVDIFSKKYIPTIASNSQSGADFEIADENGNVLAEFVNGGVVTKGFDSEKATQSNLDDSLADLNISDEDGNVLASFFNGNIKTKKFNSNKFFGKKVAFLGDSITAQGYYVNAFQSISGCYALNYGRGGSHLAKPIASDTTAFEVRYSEMDDDVDYVVVFGGTNDFGHSNVYKYNGMGTAPFGSYGDGTNDNIISFCAGVHRLFKGLSLKYVEKPIYIVTPIHHGIAVDTPEFVVSSNGSFTEGVNATTEKTFREYVDVIKEIATFYSLQVIDAYSYSRMNPIVVGTYFSDGLHLSQIGGEVFGKWLFEQIR